MAFSLPQVLDALERGREAMDAAILETPRASTQRAARIALRLKELWRGHLYACWLRSGSRDDFAVLDETGQPWSQLPPTLRDLLARATTPDTVALPVELNLPDQALQIAPIRFRQQSFGALALASTSDDAESFAFLKQCAVRLGLLLALEEAVPAPEERERLDWLSNVSELTSVVTHEFNNILNGMMLHIAVLKQEAPKEILPELDVIRGLGNNAAALIKKLQQYNGKRRAPMETVELNQAVREVVSQRSDSGKFPLQVELAAQLPNIQGKQRELLRLLVLLIRQAEDAMPQGGPITLRTAFDGKRITLRIEDQGPAIPSDELSHAFEPFHPVRAGGDEAGLAVCHTLARHMQGSLRAENPPQGGVALTVEFSPAKS